MHHSPLLHRPPTIAAVVAHRSSARHFTLDGAAAARHAVALATCPSRPLPTAIARLHAAWQRRWRRLWLDDRSAYLEDASDLADLERRQRQWDRAERVMASVWTWNR